MAHLELKYATTSEVLDALKTIQNTVPHLKARARAELARALDAVWSAGQDGDDSLPHGYSPDDFSLSSAGVARQIAHEYGLPLKDGMFKE